MLIAARKHFRTIENYEAEFDEKNGGLKLYRRQNRRRPRRRSRARNDARRGEAHRSAGRSRHRDPHSRSPPTRWAASPPRPPSRSSFRRCAKPSAKPSIANIPTASANWSTPPSSASKVSIWWSISARPKPACPSANSRVSKATAWATASAASSRSSTSRPKAPAWWFRAPTPNWSSACSSRKFRKFTTAP